MVLERDKATDDREERNRARLGRYLEEVWNKRNPNAVPQFYDPNVIDHFAAPGVPQGVDGAIATVKAMQTAFPDCAVSVDDTLAEGDRVATRMTWSGTHVGEFMGIAPTGKSFKVQAIEIIRVEGDMFVERWLWMDTLNLMQQLGLMGAPTGAGTQPQ